MWLPAAAVVCGVLPLVTRPTSGSASSVIAASEYMAPIQPISWISFCSSGAKMNCPSEPPALITPEAAPRASAGMRCAAAPISTEKLPAPAPMAETSPMAKVSPQALVMNGVMALPMASSTMPASSTGRGPQRSAAAPASGCTAPQVNCATASAKLMATMPSPVEVFSGPTNSPSDWRAPMVTIRMPAAASVMPITPGPLSALNMRERVCADWCAMPLWGAARKTAIIGPAPAACLAACAAHPG